MTDLLLQFGLSNLLLSLLIAAAAWAVHVSGRWPAVAHLLWLVVLVKLLTPPVVALPGVALPGWLGDETAANTQVITQEHPPAWPGAFTETSTLRPDAASGFDAGHRTAFGHADMPEAATAPRSVANPAAGTSGWAQVRVALVGVWLVGSTLVLAITLVRVFRFNRLLRNASVQAGPGVQRLAQDVGRRLGLRRVPKVYTTRAKLSPLVWWAGGRVRIVLPTDVAESMPAAQLRWVLAHELAHVRRRDHGVRWIEWLACVAFWWNPAAWWARRNLRANEEACCDALVLGCFSSTQDTPKHYADAILCVVESLALPALRPPAIASEINSGGTLERRFEMILSAKTLSHTPRWARTLVLLGAVGLMPLGLAQADELAPKPGDREARQVDLDQAAERIRRAIQAGEITAEEGRRKMAEVRAMQAHGDHAQREQHRERHADHDRTDTMGMDEETYDAIVAYLAKEGVGRIQMEATLGGLIRITHAVMEQGDGFEMHDEMVEYLSTEVGLNRDQIGMLVDVARKLAAETAQAAQHAAHDGDVDIRGYFVRMGVDEAMLDRIVGALREHGVGQVQIDPTLGGLFHTILAIKEYGLEAAMESIDAHDFFSEQVGLSDEQIELVAGLAQHIYAGVVEAHQPHEGHQERRDGEGHGERGDAHAQIEAALARLKAAVEAGEINVERARERVEALRRQLAERTAQREADARRDGDRAARERDGDRARRDREAAERERGVRDGERQRREQGQRDGTRGDDDKVDPHARAERVRAALASGDLTRDEARRHLTVLREQMAHQIELALEAGKITREEAREKIAAIREMTQLPDGDGR